MQGALEGLPRQEAGGAVSTGTVPPCSSSAAEASLQGAHLSAGRRALGLQPLCRALFMYLVCVPASRSSPPSPSLIMLRGSGCPLSCWESSRQSPGVLASLPQSPVLSPCLSSPLPGRGMKISCCSGPLQGRPGSLGVGQEGLSGGLVWGGGRKAGGAAPGGSAPSLGRTPESPEG